VRQEDKRNDEAAAYISEDNLKKCEVRVISETGNADDGQRAGFGSDNRKRNCPPWDVASSEELVTQAALSFAKAKSEQCDSDEIDRNNGEVETVEAHALQ